MKDINQIAELHSSLWRFHDEKNWEKLKNIAEEMISLFGYPKTVAKTVAPHIVKTFQIADLAEEARIKGDFFKETGEYKNLQREFEETYNLLGVNKKPALFKVRWIHASRHNNRLSVFFNLFMEHLTLFSNKKILTVIKLTLVSIRDIYPAHNAHNWKDLNKAFLKYWLIMQKSIGEDKNLLPQF